MPTPKGSKPWRDPAMQTYGGKRKLTSSLQNVKGLCQAGKKCMRKSLHDGKCWPADDV